MNLTDLHFILSPGKIILNPGYNHERIPSCPSQYLTRRLDGSSRRRQQTLVRSLPDIDAVHQNQHNQ